MVCIDCENLQSYFITEIIRKSQREKWKQATKYMRATIDSSNILNRRACKERGAQRMTHTETSEPGCQRAGMPASRDTSEPGCQRAGVPVSWDTLVMFTSTLHYKVTSHYKWLGNNIMVAIIFRPVTQTFRPVIQTILCVSLRQSIIFWKSNLTQWQTANLTE